MAFRSRLVELARAPRLGRSLTRARTRAGRGVAPPRTATLAALLIAGCARHEPPAPAGSPSTAWPEVEPGIAASARAPSAPAAESSAATVTATPVTATPVTATPVTATPVTATPVTATPATPDVDPARLPQTRDVPGVSGAAFQARAAALGEAIVRDDPQRAMAFFFPLAAYEQVKDVANPAADWKGRLVAAYVRDIHALHARLQEAQTASSGSGAPRDGAGARFVALDVPDARARWVEPGEEYNKIGYFRVFGSRLRFDVEGPKQTVRTFDVKSLISWRGEWYVVHLSGIK